MMNHCVPYKADKVNNHCQLSFTSYSLLLSVVEVKVYLHEFQQCSRTQTEEREEHQ